MPTRNWAIRIVHQNFAFSQPVKGEYSSSGELPDIRAVAICFAGVIADIINLTMVKFSAPL